MKKRVDYYLSTDTIDKLVDIKKKLGIPYSVIIQKALELYFLKFNLEERAKVLNG